MSDRSAGGEAAASLSSPHDCAAHGQRRDRRPGLDTALAFFVALGLELEDRASIEGAWADETVGLAGVRSEIAMVRTPDGAGRVELTEYHYPPAGEEVGAAPPNTAGLHRIMFAVDDIDATVERLRPHGAELLGRVADYQGVFRLCYLRGPAGIIIALAERIG